ncbi:hypothetical protein Tsubulata_006236 [Turnera subulata]|uniref:IBH1-like N-terminal domain-containing protein n=1 Tax=Turnera subulata TaxID=218843 RepID=A0A9Q0JA03_9ROSI|nr:hypothetical protein Tsubulata_006236 [Turnera subulata]
MRAPSSLKKEFMKKWISGLQACSSAKQHMNILERKKAIKLSADIAMASTRNGRTCWSRALIANASKDGENKALVEQLLANDEVEKLNNHKQQFSAGSVRPCCNNNKRVRCKKILKNIRCVRSRARKNVPRVVSAKSIAKRMVQKRTQVLKSLVPGGEFMDGISLVEETLDYIVSLRAQVDVMRILVKATETMNRKATTIN